MTIFGWKMPTCSNSALPSPLPSFSLTQGFPWVLSTPKAEAGLSLSSSHSSPLRRGSLPRQPGSPGPLLERGRAGL